MTARILWELQLRQLWDQFWVIVFELKFLFGRFSKSIWTGWEENKVRDVDAMRFHTVHYHFCILIQYTRMYQIYSLLSNSYTTLISLSLFLFRSTSTLRFFHYFCFFFSVSFSTFLFISTDNIRLFILHLKFICLPLYFRNKQSKIQSKQCCDNL